MDLKLGFIFTPVSHASKPVLSDDPVIDTEGPAAGVFFTPEAQSIERNMGLIVAVASGVALAVAWIIALSHGPDPLRKLFILLAFATAGVPALTEVWSKLSKFRIDIDLLMLLGAVLAAYIGSPFEGALLLFLFALSGGLEAFAVRRTQTAIVALRRLTPTEATVMDGETTHRVSLRQVAIGAALLVRPGEKVPLDGIVLGGSSSLDESAITGESIPRDCTVGDAVFAGTQNLNGRLEVRVTKLAADTTLAKVVKLVTEARLKPARAQRLIDRIGPPYSIGVIFGSVLVAVGGALLFDLTAQQAIHRAIAVLIVASPCALIIATPVAYLSAIAAAARQGVLVKGGAHLEIVAKARAVAFDKTGTLTTGHVRLVEIGFDDIGETEALRIAGAIESSSTHPLANAVSEEVKHRDLTPYAVTDYTATPGQGAEGTVNNRRVWVGRPECVTDRAPHDAAQSFLQRTEQLRRNGRTVSAVVIDDRVGYLAFEDTVRDGSPACITRLRDQGIHRVDMLTGDHKIIAEQVASRLSLDGYLAELAPEDKLAAAERLKADHGSLVLVGDGINDAPALAHADAGIAMGSMGADVALDAADIVLMQDRIERVAWLHKHALRTASIVRQNLTLAIAVIAVLSVFAMMGRIPLPLAVIGHEGSTVLVALNALRLLRTGENEA